MLLIVAIGLHVYYMRFLKYPQEVKVKNETEYIVTVTDDPGLSSVAKRLDVQLEKGKQDTYVATSENIGTSFLLVVRDTYKSILLCVLYSLFVFIAAFHGANGLWTFLITWGVTLTEHARSIFRHVSVVLFALLLFLGLSCIWGVYWINLRS
jgi:succinate dehydrogenase / fumarate reductase cytochrome b subunit